VGLIAFLVSGGEVTNACPRRSNAHEVCLHTSPACLRSASRATRLLCAAASTHCRLRISRAWLRQLARGPDVFIGILHAISMPFSFFLGWATILIEVIGGLLILCGLLCLSPPCHDRRAVRCNFHRPPAQRIRSIKLVAYDGSGAHFGQPGYESALLYLAALLALCFGGAGPLSLDGYVSARPRAERLGSPNQGRVPIVKRLCLGKK
jgi:putative oxidoreductase